MTADPTAPARRKISGSHGCVVPERILPRRVWTTEDVAEFNAGTRRASEHGSIAQDAAARARAARRDQGADS